MELAYRELDFAANGSPEHIHALGDLHLLPRPWIPASCDNPALRREVWAWLDAVVEWLNHEHTWDPAAAIPGCWPLHPHLIQSLAVLADQRHAAESALTSDPLEEWHRYALPAFTERFRQTLKNYCDEGHQTCHARARHARYNSSEEQEKRRAAFNEDVRLT